MERLTKRSDATIHENGVCCVHFMSEECCKRHGDCAAGCPWEEAAWSRLADYEDTALTPGEIKSMQGEHFSALEMAKLHSALMELKKYQEAEQSGRVVVLPCKVGDAVWFARSAYRQVDNPIEATVTGFASYGTTGELIFTTMTVEGQITRRFLEHQIGKTAFLSFEEAERALEERKNV